MRLVVEIPDNQVQAIQLYLTMQRSVEVDRESGAPRFRDAWGNAVSAVPSTHDAAEFILTALATTIHGVLLQCPTEEMRQQLAAYKKMEQLMKDAAKPKVLELHTVTTAPLESAAPQLPGDVKPN